MSPWEIKLGQGIQRKTLISAFDKEGIESLFLSQPPTEKTTGECRTPSLTTQVGISFPSHKHTDCYNLLPLIVQHFSFFKNSILIPMPGKSKKNPQTNQEKFSNIKPGNVENISHK